MPGNKSLKSQDMSRAANDVVMSSMADMDPEVAATASRLNSRFQGGGAMCGSTSTRYLSRHDKVAGNPAFVYAERVVDARRRLQRRLEERRAPASKPLATCRETKAVVDAFMSIDIAGACLVASVITQEVLALRGVEREMVAGFIKAPEDGTWLQHFWLETPDALYDTGYELTCARMPRRRRYPAIRAEQLPSGGRVHPDDDPRMRFGYEHYKVDPTGFWDHAAEDAMGRKCCDIRARLLRLFDA